jgi:hypothetical protein
MKTHKNKNKNKNNVKTKFTKKGGKSFSPLINQNLVPLLSLKQLSSYNRAKPSNQLSNLNRSFFDDCGVRPLKIIIPKTSHGCIDYDDPRAIKYLIKQLKKNKYINPDKIILPVQNDNQNQFACWFNSLFAVLFVSDKGRKFFHFFRQLMIEGIQSNGEPIKPKLLKDAFALFNYGIELCLSGNSNAYQLNNLEIIQNIYDSIYDTAREDLNQSSHFYINKRYITPALTFGWPIYYILTILKYLNNNDLKILFIPIEQYHILLHSLKNVDNTDYPDIIFLQILQREAHRFNKKEIITINSEIYYTLDSVIVSTSGHIVSCITCEKKQYCYDDSSNFSNPESFDSETPQTLLQMNWKKLINKNQNLEFPNSETNSEPNSEPNSVINHNFKQSEQILIYYRNK